MKSNRIERIEFSSADMAADSDGNISGYASRPINGEIMKVNYRVGTAGYDVDGSVALQVSGTAEPIWEALGGLTSDITQYPIVYPVDETAVTGSPQAVVRRVVGPEGQLQIWGSGLGPTSGGYLDVYYRG